MKENFYLVQAELIKIENKFFKMSEKYKEYKEKIDDIINFIKETREDIESETK